MAWGLGSVQSLARLLGPSPWTGSSPTTFHGMSWGQDPRTLGCGAPRRLRQPRATSKQGTVGVLGISRIPDTPACRLLEVLDHSKDRSPSQGSPEAQGLLWLLQTGVSQAAQGWGGTWDSVEGAEMQCLWCPLCPSPQTWARCSLLSL